MKPPPPNLEENLPFRRAKTVVQRASAGQFTEPMTTAKLLVLKEQKKVADRIQIGPLLNFCF